MASPFDFPNLAPYQQVAATQMIEQGRRVPLQEMIAAYQQGQALQQAPQLARQKALSDQLALEIQRANLEKMKRPELHNVAGVGLVQVDPANPAGYRVVAPAVTRSASTASTAPKLGRIIVDQPTGRIFEVTPTGMRERTLDESLNDQNPSQDLLLRNPQPIVSPTTGGQVETLIQPNAPSGVLTPITPKVPALRSTPTLTPKKGAGEKPPPAKIQDQYLGAQNLFKTAPRLEQKIAELRAAGVEEPTAFEKTIINQAYQDPKGLISGFATAIATGQIRPEIAELEQIRAEIESNYTVSKAGLSQTASEVGRTIPVAPTRFDSWDRQINKTKNLKEVAAINVGNINKQYPGFAKSQPGAVQIIDYASEAEVPSDLPSGTHITIQGRPAIWE